MADDTTRIINLTEATEISDGMYLVTDASTGTRKLSLQKVLDKSGGNVADEYDSSATYDVGDLVVYKGVLYECSSAITTAEAWNPDHWSRINLGDIVADIDGSIEELYEDKANESGEYDDIVAGTAKQLLSSIFTTNDSPYIYRPTPADSDRERVKRIEGLSVGWNQITDISEAQTVTFNSDTSNYFGTFGNIGHNYTAIVGHKYLFGVDVSRQISGNDLVGIGMLLPTTGIVASIGNGTPDGWVYSISQCENAQTGSSFSYNNYNGKRGYNAGDTISVKASICVDLTVYFGSNTIPDYVLSLETATSGSGIAWLKTYCPKLFEPNPYSAPTIKSVEGLESHDMVGWNQWDEEWELGTFDTTTGANVAGTSQIRTKNLIPIISGHEYCFAVPSGIWTMFLDADKNPIPITAPSGHYQTSGNCIQLGSSNNNRLLTVPNNAKYSKFYCQSSYGTTYNHDICINLSDPSRNGQYEPYEKHSYPLDSTITLRGIPKLVEGKLVEDGDWYEASGKQTVRYGIVDLGTLNWTYNSSDSYFSTSKPSDSKAGDSSLIGNIICAKYPTDARNTQADKTIAISPSYLFIKDSAYSDATTFKASLSGVYLVYELATPTTSTASPYAEVEICDADGTEEFVTDSPVPVGHLTEYTANLRRQVENIYGIPKPPTTDGDYALKLSIADGVPTYTWESES